MKIRRALPDDWPQIVPLLVELGQSGLAEPEQSEALHKRFIRYLEQVDAVALVADVDGEVAGFLNIEFRERFTQSAPQAWLANFVVSSSRRRQGIAHALLVEAEAFALGRGCHALFGEPGFERTEGQALLSKESWVERGVALVKYLND